MTHIRFENSEPSSDDIMRINTAPVVFPVRTAVISGTPNLMDCDCTKPFCLGRMEAAIFVEDTNDRVLIAFHDAKELAEWAKTLVFQAAEKRAKS